MRIALVGYGKMGKAIESFAIDRGHEISFRITKETAKDIRQVRPDNTDVAIEFTTPDTAFDNCITLLKNKVKVITGTTGWLEKVGKVEETARLENGTFLVASNFSIGVNLFYKVNEYLAELMSRFDSYTPEITEIHHIHKLDKPSGTAISISEPILKHLKNYGEWKLGSSSADSLGINSLREGEVPGTHIVDYKSKIDAISIKHEAHGRDGFALGAIMVAEWIKNKSGIYSMDDFINI